jgi:ABC-type dipeptide/oligopeptide/nickel transport system ATPase component
MKKFPRLYSLCTLGIRQHQEFDYQFHGFRTDFVGDSGCGKSMIADLVQLVFVGSEVFASGTDSMDKREVDGMVLRTAGGRGTDMGYVLVNIEVEPSQYVAIGAYLESSSRQSRSFVIQGDYNENELKLLNRPLTVSDICIDDQIPTIEWFKESLEEKGFIFHSIPQRKKFHAFLYKHQLLSLDLSQSNQILRDYAMIIQSFSRGKSLDISDSNSIKRFLFGNEKAREIAEKYKKAVEELQQTLKEHAINRTEIELVTKKYQALKTLKEFKDQLDADQNDFLIRHCAYVHQRELEEYKSFKESGKEYTESINTLWAIQEILRDELLVEEETIADLVAEEERAKKQYHKNYSTYSQLLPFSRLLEEYGCADTTMIEIYQKYQQDKYRHQLISTIGGALKKNGLRELLNNYIGLAELTPILDAIQEGIAINEALCHQKEQLLAFTDLNNKGSLGNWAIQNYQAHTLVVESLLMFFKDLPVTRANEFQDRFIPDPDLLLNIEHTIDEGKNGFWIMLGQISQFIPYIKNQLFSVEDIGELKSLLATMSQDLKGELFELTNALKGLKSLKQFVLGNAQFAEFLEVYQFENSLIDFGTISELDIAKQEFETGITLLKDAERINSNFQAAETAWKNSQTAVHDYKRVVSNLKRTDAQLKNLLAGSSPQPILDIIIDVFPELETVQSDWDRELLYLRSTFSKSAVKDAWIKDAVTDSQQKLKLQDINKQLEDYKASIKMREDVFKEAGYILEREPDISAYVGQYVHYPKEEEKEYGVSKSVYENKFLEIVAAFAVGESYRFEESQNYLELCTVILPDAFLEEKIEKESSIEVIGEYLSKINDKNKSLNNRKLLKIRDILDEVGDEVSKREDTVRQIHNFLDNGAREITGRHRVSLRSNTMNCYPKGWINAYIEKLTQENTLFATGQTLTELLSDSVSLEEKMINAFHTFGGHRGSKPKVEDLLNPNSYFDLTFKMESQASGKTNIGSTGQVYAAIALLCIARLSLVNKSSFNKNPPPGIRFMPIDEAEGLGSNFDLLYDIARDFDYQILTMGIKPLGRFREGEQYIYMLSNNKEALEDVNYHPFAVFCEADQIFNQ